jgi:hypothetical protein
MPKQKETRQDKLLYSQIDSQIETFKPFEWKNGKVEK